MKASGQGTSVTILDKEFCINCPPGKETLLRGAAHYLDMQMRHIRKSGRVIGIERIAIMAALNIASELLDLKENREIQKSNDDFLDRIKLLHDKIDVVLAKNPIKEAESCSTEMLSADGNFSSDSAIETLDVDAHDDLITEERPL